MIKERKGRKRHKEVIAKVQLKLLIIKGLRDFYKNPQSLNYQRVISTFAITSKGPKRRKGQMDIKNTKF